MYRLIFWEQNSTSKTKWLGHDRELRGRQSESVTIVNAVNT